MKIKNNTSLRTWDEARTELFTAEEIAECDREVAALGDRLKAQRTAESPTQQTIARPIAHASTQPIA